MVSYKRVPPWFLPRRSALVTQSTQGRSVDLNEVAQIVMEVIRSNPDQRDTVAMSEIDHRITVRIMADMRREVGRLGYVEAVDIALDLKHVAVLEIHHDIA